MEGKHPKQNDFLSSPSFVLLRTRRSTQETLNLTVINSYAEAPSGLTADIHERLVSLQVCMHEKRRRDAGALAGQ